MHKGIKRVVSSLLLGTLLLSNVTFSAYAKEFSDVPENQWYSESINWVSDYGLMLGTSANIFNPDEDLTRSMFAQILYNMIGKPEVDGINDFIDVNHNKWYNDAIDWASENGIMSGYGNSKFGPDDVITREQMAKVLQEYTRVLPIPRVGGILDSYQDASKISAWARGGMEWAVANKLIYGTSKDTLSPTDSATRAQVATIIERYCKTIASEVEWPGGKDYFDSQVSPKPDDVEEGDYSYLLNPDLSCFKQTNNGYSVYKYLGDLENSDINEDSVTLYVKYNGGDKRTVYRVYPGRELSFGYTYGPGHYDIDARLWIPYKGTQTVFSTSIEVSEEQYNKSMLASMTYYDYRTSSQLQTDARKACISSTYVEGGAKTDEEKAKAIYMFMCHKLKYDFERIDEVEWGYTPAYDKIIEENEAICLDFAGVYAAMCRSEGIPARIVVGWVNKGTENEGYHAWNEVYYNGEWHLVDPTRGISNSQGVQMFIDLLNMSGFYPSQAVLDRYTVEYWI